MTEIALVVGLGRSGEAAARHLRERGAHVIAVDDFPTEEVLARAAASKAELVSAPGLDILEELVSGVDVVVPSPGIAVSHPVFAIADQHQVPVRGELELASRWARRPMIAVTGTNGKTTVTSLITEMLIASGLKAVAAGNIGLPLSDAVRRDVNWIVVEVSSFQLRFIETFHPAVAVWLNVGEDHLDWHSDMVDYITSKARIWENQTKRDMAVVNADDPVVMGEAGRAPSKVVTFAWANQADYYVEEGVLRGPAGDLLAVADLPRALPFDQLNALAAAAAATAAGAKLEGIRRALREYRGLKHRLSLVAESGGIRWYDDSKATNPHAAVAAIKSFESVVLLAGGRNKGLDLTALTETTDRLRAVVAFGEAAGEVESAFAGRARVLRAASMDEAVVAAASVAEVGDAVLLSPACASFDAYRNYEQRGDDFERAVLDLVHPESAEMAGGEDQP